jgi:hypothetical protein
LHSRKFFSFVGDTIETANMAVEGKTAVPVGERTDLAVIRHNARVAQKNQRYSRVATQLEEEKGAILEVVPGNILAGEWSSLAGEVFSFAGENFSFASSV